MAGKFLRRAAIVDTIKDEQRTNAIQKRQGLTRHAVTTTSCGCPDPACGAWHTIGTSRTIPTSGQCIEILARDKKSRKNGRR